MPGSPAETGKLPGLTNALNPSFDAARQSLNRLRRLAESAQKSPSHALAVAEADIASHHVDAVPPRFEHQARRFDAQPLDSLRRRLSRFFPECARELPRAQMRGIRELFDGKRRVQIAPRVRQRRLD